MIEEMIDYLIMKWENVDSIKNMGFSSKKKVSCLNIHRNETQPKSFEFHFDGFLILRAEKFNYL